MGSLVLGLVALFRARSITRPLTDKTTRKAIRCFTQEEHIVMLVIVDYVGGAIFVCVVVPFPLDNKTVEILFAF